MTMLDALAEFGGCCFSLHPGSFRCIREAEKDFNGFVLIFSVSRRNARARTPAFPQASRCIADLNARNSL